MASEDFTLKDYLTVKGGPNPSPRQTFTVVFSGVSTSKITRIML
jgi:hypothetical protein